MTNIISFPNLGISFKINRVAFTLFGRDIYLYAIILACGMIGAVLYSIWRAKKSEGIGSDDIIDYGISAIICAIIGARLYYVLTTLDNYHSFVDVIAIWNGGLGFYGGLIGGVLAVIVLSKIKKINVFKVFDLASPALLLGQLVGRWGNFVNGEAYGSCDFFEFFGFKLNLSGCKNLPWLMKIENISDGVAVSSVLCQPTFLYESLWNIVGFVLLNVLYKKKKFDGQIFLYYLCWYGFGRMIIEGLRTDSLYVGNIKISQLVGLLCFIVCAVLIFVGPKIFKSKNNDNILAVEENQNGENN